MLPPSVSESSRLLAVDMFLKAHDFALLSEEEEGELLTKGHLACEDFDGPYMLPMKFDFTTPVKSTDICSEFSAQCLVLSVTCEVNVINLQDKIISNRLAKSANCLIASMAEISTLNKSEVKEELERSLVWLCLHLLIALGDDSAFCFSLLDGGLLDRLQTELSGESTTIERETNKNERHSLSLNHIFDVACRAESFHLLHTAGHLFSLCVGVLIRTRKICIGKESNSVGSIQKRIIQYASGVEDVRKVFEDVDRIIKSRSTIGSDGTAYNPYSSEDIDFFAIEAHNKAVSLIFIGDVCNAEKMLTISLNLIPFSGREVEGYSTEIRRTYRGVVEHRGIGGGSIIPYSSGEMMNLFGTLEK